jgi:3-hydroxyacyl-CoA dehydrogenase
MRPDALLATNTSSLSVDELAAGLTHPERFCGFHFFNPVHRMPLVEVVRGRKTSDATIVTAVALARRLGKTPVVVRDSPGFVVNRILMPYLREAMHLLEDGYPMLEIDAAMREFGMPMGPFEVLDEVGLDVAKNAAEVLTRAFPDRMTASPILEKMVAAGRLGKKSGLGFYRHRGRSARRRPGCAGSWGCGARAGRQPREPGRAHGARDDQRAARCLEGGDRVRRRHARPGDGVRRRLPAVPRRAAALRGLDRHREGRGRMSAMRRGRQALKPTA